MPLIKKLEREICCCYGIGFPRNWKYTNEPLEKMVLTKIPTRVSWFLIEPMCKLMKLPLYYSYWCIQRIFDAFYSRRVAKDDSTIVFTYPLLLKTVKSAKKAGKVVVVEAGNSEPIREYKRIMEEYNKYGIKHKYIYGNLRYGNMCKQSYEIADYIINISNVSMQTYINAGYPREKLKLIPMTGTDFYSESSNVCGGEEKEKAFITTVYHSFIKGTQRLLLAWSEADVKNYKLYVVGELCEDMIEFVNKYGPFQNVVFVGHRSDLCEWYKKFNAVGILLSLSEGAGRVVPEMMTFGFPMLVSRDATCDIVRDGYNGWIVDYYDKRKVIEIIRYLTDDWNRVDKLKDNVISSVEHRTMKDWSLELADFLRKLLIEES